MTPTPPKRNRHNPDPRVVRFETALTRFEAAARSAAMVVAKVRDGAPSLVIVATARVERRRAALIERYRRALKGGQR